MYMRTRYFIAGILLLALFAGCSSDSGEGDAPGGGSGDLYGYVRDASGSAIEGVVVSDGYTCTVTGADGRYAMQRHPNAYYVYYSTPADCKVEVDPSTGLPLFYQKIRKSQPQYDFTLTRQAEETKFRMLAIGDPQVTTTAQVYRFETETVADINSYVAAQTDGLPTYAITLGDIVGNKWELYPDMVKAMARSKTSVPVFQTIGNHDHDQTTLLKDSLGTMHYEMHLGPTCYSANIGRVHYIFIDDILYDRKDAKESYRHGLYDETVHWLIEDLKYVPKDKIIMICAHAQMFNKKTTMVRRNKNFAAYSKALLDFKYVYSWAGHNHHTYLYTSEPERNYDIDNLTSITVTKSTGALRLNRLLNNDGTPQGYFVVDVDGEEVSWYYLCCGKDRNYQMKVYPPARTGGEYVMANIWAHDNKWGAVEWWENGVKVGQMEAHDALDPDYVDLYATVTNKTTRKYCKPVNSFHMFRIRPEPGVKAGEVRVTDRFGTTYVERVSW